jgi:purine nucleosidase
LARALVFMGGSLNPTMEDEEFANNPRHEFNFWFDPEVAYIVLRAPWKKIVCTPTDISIKTRLTRAMVKRIEARGTALGRHIARFYQEGGAPTSCGTNWRRPRGSTRRRSQGERLAT